MAKQVKGIASEKRTPFTQEQLNDIEKMCQAGLTTDQMALILGMSKQTWERHIKDTPGGDAAVEKGRAAAIREVGSTAFCQAKSGRNTAMTIFYLKCRGRWREADPEIKVDPIEDLKMKEQRLLELESLITSIKEDLVKSRS